MVTPGKEYGFIEYSNDLGSSYAGSYSRMSDLTNQLNQQKRDYEGKIKVLEAKLEEKDIRIEELETKLEESKEEVWMEREEAEKALNKAREWREH